MIRVLLYAVLLVSAVFPVGGTARAATIVRAAVAGNFAQTAAVLARSFRAASGIRVEISIGSTGVLYAQIRQGAPYDIFLAADRARPERLETAGLVAPGSRFTYALGQLVLWSADPRLIGGDARAALKSGRFRPLAMADPKVAPYGQAAMQVLAALAATRVNLPHIVRAQNVSQAFAYVATGNAAAGLVARASVMSPHYRGKGSLWLVPKALYAPIAQDAVRLKTSPNATAAARFLAYMRGPEGRAIIAGYGYGTGQ